MVHRRALWTGGALGLPLVLATFLTLIPSNEWWIRIFDFPRVQIAALLAILLVGLGAAAVWRTRRGLLLLFGLALALAHQGFRILPYTMFYPNEVAETARCARDDRISYMEANVLQQNRDAAALIALVREQQPDILLLTETDRWWADQLRPLAGEFPHAVRVPLENTYGMMLLSRRPLVAPDVRYLLEPDVPSIRTGIKLASGRVVDLYGVHPRPPRPGQDTADRDAELVMVGREVRLRKRHAIVAGDLNDVVWSRTTSLFQEVSGLLDPRVGRQLMPTFPAALPFLRWPLDYIFVSPGFELLSMMRLRKIGSDHLPIIVHLCAARLKASYLAPPELGQDARGEAREVIREARQGTADKL